MGEVCHRPDSLVDLPGLAEELVGIGGRTIHLRCIHHQEDSLDLVEKVEERDGKKCAQKKFILAIADI